MIFDQGNMNSQWVLGEIEEAHLKEWSRNLTLYHNEN